MQHLHFTSSSFSVWTFLLTAFEPLAWVPSVFDFSTFVMEFGNLLILPSELFGLAYHKDSILKNLRVFFQGIQILKANNV